MNHNSVKYYYLHKKVNKYLKSIISMLEILSGHTTIPFRVTQFIVYGL